MRVLTVRQPWASAIIHGNTRVPAKDVENRTRNIAGAYRGPVAIHAAVAYDEPAFHTPTGVLADWFDWVGDPLMDETRGHIIGVVDLVDVTPATDMTQAAKSPWAEPNGWHLLLANPRALAEPILHTGGLGLRKTDFGIHGDWFVEYQEPCPSPCAGPGYGCPPGCHMEPLTRLEAIA